MESPVLVPSSVSSPAVPLITAAKATVPTTNSAKVIEAHNTTSLLTLPPHSQRTDTLYPTAGRQYGISDSRNPLAQLPVTRDQYKSAFDGLLAKDKFCMIRHARLSL